MATSEPAPTDAPEDQRRLKAPYVYIDASVYRAEQFDWTSKRMLGIEDLVRRNMIQVVVTDITRREARSQMGEHIEECRRSILSRATTLRLLGHAAVIERLSDKDACVNAMDAEFTNWLKRCQRVICSQAADLTAIMEDYFGGKPPFGSGKKKSEFPDAVVVSMLRAWCAEKKRNMYVVSGDKDMKTCCTEDGPLFHAVSLGEVLSHARVSVAVHDAVSAAVRRDDALLELLRDQASDLRVEVRPGMTRKGVVETEVTDVSLDDLEIDEVLLDELDGTNISCTAYVTASLLIRIKVMKQPFQIGEDEWDHGFYDNTRAWVSEGVNVVIQATQKDSGAIELNNAFFDVGPIRVEFEEIASQL